MSTTERPASATHGSVAAAALAAFLAGLVLLYLWRPNGQHIVDSALLLLSVTALTCFGVDLWLRDALLRDSTGLDWAQRQPSWSRTGAKLIGLYATISGILVLYWLFPEYHGDFYRPYYGLLIRLLPLWLIFSVPYFYLVDARMREPRDGYWHIGQAALLNWQAVDKKILGQHALGSLIKGFFLPLMFVALCQGLKTFLDTDFHQIKSFQKWFDFIFGSLYLIDVGLVTMGYLLTLRITDTHIRSAEPTLSGWVVALICYAPFWPFIGQQYLAYEPKLLWGAWLWDYPLIYAMWGTLILVLVAIYTWATVSFGARFSNLTHRGIITNGPYRYTKHPAYLAKNLSWWFISVPFLITTSVGETLRHCALLVGLNLIYFLRARTEERHLSVDPVYRQYARWIDSHGLVGRVSRALAFRRSADCDRSRYSQTGSTGPNPEPAQTGKSPSKAP